VAAVLLLAPVIFQTFTMHKLARYFAISSLLLIFVSLNTSAQNIAKTEDGVVLHPDANLAGNAQAVKLQVITGNIIRVMASASANFAHDKSLITVYSKPTEKNFTITETIDAVVLKTQLLSATINKQTGAVSFTDVNGKPILKEKQTNGRSLKPVAYDGEGFYKIKQTFETTADDALYGLGQHQDGIMNYRNQQVYFFQNNS